MISFTVYGEPRPQGSKQAQVIYNGQGKPVTKNGRIVAVVRDDNKDLRNWRNQVADRAMEAYRSATSTSPDNAECPEPCSGPFSLFIKFIRPRPKYHYGTGRNEGKLKASAPKYPTKKPDTVKLARAVEDAMTSVIWIDDSQVVEHTLQKRFGSRFETHIVITSLKTVRDHNDDGWTADDAEWDDDQPTHWHALPGEVE